MTGTGELAARNIFVCAATAASALFLFGSIIGYTYFEFPRSFTLSNEMLAEDFKNFWTVLIKIFTTNFTASLLLLSGTVTFGFSSMLSIWLVGLFVGATAKIGVTNIGMFNLLSDTILYIPFEFSGLILSAAAGLLPAIGKLCQLSTKIGKISYPRLMLPSLKVFWFAVILISTGSIIESTLIVLKY